MFCNVLGKNESKSCGIYNLVMYITYTTYVYSTLLKTHKSVAVPNYIVITDCNKYVEDPPHHHHPHFIPLPPPPPQSLFYLIHTGHRGEWLQQRLFPIITCAWCHNEINNPCMWINVTVLNSRDPCILDKQCIWGARPKGENIMINAKDSLLVSHYLP